MTKPSGKPSARKLVPQEHGGALLPGGTGAYGVGPGRPPSELRRLAGKHFEDLLPELRRIGGEGEREVDRVKAIVALGRFGIGEAKGYDEALVEALGSAVREDVSDEVWGRIRARWVAIIGLHVRGA